MPSLTQIRDAAVAAIRAVCPEAKRVEAFSGELDLDTAKGKILPSGLSVLVAVLEAENANSVISATSGLCLDLTGTFAVLVAVNDTRSREMREARALAVAEAVTVAVHGKTFGLAGVGPALVLSLSPFSGDELDKSGLSVWSVIWQQGFTFTQTSAFPPQNRLEVKRKAALRGSSHLHSLACFFLCWRGLCNWFRYERWRRWNNGSLLTV